jgi:glutaredoxin-related protein
MQTYTIKSYEVWTNTDLTEGRGRQKLIARFSDQSDAFEFAKNKGVMGTPADVVWNEEEIKIYDSLTDIWETKQEALKQSAYAKLTKEEIAALGI